jgi:hypothetical protein
MVGTMSDETLKTLLEKLRADRASDVHVESNPQDPSHPYIAVSGGMTTGVSMFIDRDQYALLVANGAVED